MPADYFELRLTDSSQPATGRREELPHQSCNHRQERTHRGWHRDYAESKSQNLDVDNYFIGGGVVAVLKNAVIPAGFWL